MTSPGNRTGIANLPLHGGKAPAWLFQRMVKLARELTVVIVGESGGEDMLRRLSDPHWFQAFGCVLGFDWHSSGVTTTVCGALKEGIKGMEKDLGLFVAGGKGNVARRTPAEIEHFAPVLKFDPAPLIYASRMSAKVDSTALQDGFQIYHHAFFFTRDGAWSVVQQGMKDASRYARRYHWLGPAVTSFVCEPHAAICSDTRGQVLNLVAQESNPARETISQIAVQVKPDKLISELKRVQTLSMPSRHPLLIEDISPDRIYRTLASTYERQPKGFEELLALPGVGPKTMRALSLLSEIAYGVPASFRDPARFSFAHGGKDGTPFPVDRQTYDMSIHILHEAIRKAKLGQSDRMDAFRRLRAWM